MAAPSGVDQGPQVSPTGPSSLAAPIVATVPTGLAPIDPAVFAAPPPSVAPPASFLPIAAPAVVAPQVTAPQVTAPQVTAPQAIAPQAIVPTVIAAANPPASLPAVGGASPPAVALRGASPQNPLLPANGGVGGDLLTCAAPNCLGQGWTYFDPKVAIGYDFQLLPSGLTGPSVGVTDIRVSTKVGDGDYQLYLLDTSGAWIDVAPIDANPDGIAADDFNVAAFLGALSLAEDQEFGITDPADGLSQFSIRGIDPDAGLDPTNPQSFIAGLQFAGPFTGNVLITPLVLDTATGIDPPDNADAFEIAVVPEPPTLPIFAAGLLGLVLLRRRVARPASRV
jgi:hypothetical protein